MEWGRRGIESTVRGEDGEPRREDGEWGAARWGALPTRRPPARPHPVRRRPGGPGGPIPPEDSTMPRYVIERTFAAGLHIPLTDEGVHVCQTVGARNGELGVNWVHSYVS